MESNLASISRAEKLLMEADTPEKTNNVIDLASHIVATYKRISMSTAEINKAEEYKLKAIRKIVSQIRQGQEAGGGSCLTLRH